jgi:hypothetical protein
MTANTTVKYLSFDPGKTVGIAAYDSDCKLLWLQTIKNKDLDVLLLDTIDLSACSHFVYEGYKIYPDKAYQHIYSDLETAQCIGKLKTVAQMKRIATVEQGAYLKRNGFKFLGISPPKKSDPTRHQLDAHAHGTYFLVSTGRLDPSRLL